MRKNSNTLRAIAVGLTVATAGTAFALYATPVIAQQSQIAAAVADTVPTKPDTTKPQPKPDTTMPTMPTIPSQPDTVKPDTDTTVTPTPGTRIPSTAPALPVAPIKPF